jgi:hypothetical protein
MKHAGVVGGDFQPAQQHLQPRRGALQSLGNPQRALDVPQVAGEADEARAAPQYLFDESLVA